jgi:hypothetical protein
VVVDWVDQNDNEHAGGCRTTAVGRCGCRKVRPLVRGPRCRRAAAVTQRVTNDEAALRELISTITTLADGGEVTWAINLNGGGAALPIALLIAAEQRLLYILAAPSITPRAATAVPCDPANSTARST